MFTRRITKTMLRRARAAGLAAVVVAAGAASIAAGPQAPRTNWKTDAAWYAGKAEWALYDAVRPIYNADRHYEATIFTNKQWMNTDRTTKAAGEADAEVEVFKHNISEIIPTDNYAYRYLTTSFIRTDNLSPYKVVMSSQEDCGATYKQFVVAGDGRVNATEYCYFPETGHREEAYDAPANLAFHDTLTLTLRDYPFDAADRPTLPLNLVPDATLTKPTPQTPGDAIVRYLGRETVDVPYGEVATHHLRVEHPSHGGTTRSDYWFAADPGMRHVLVQYEGPFGVQYRLKRLEWWAYWSDPRPE